MPEAERGNLRVLLVEDDESFRWITRRMLQRAGYDIVGEAVDGRDGVDASRELRPDVVLLDLRMPVMDGFEALPLIREASPGSRVIVYTGLASEGVRTRVEALGAYEVVEKEPSMDALFRILDRVAEELSSPESRESR